MRYCARAYQNLQIRAKGEKFTVLQKEAFYSKHLPKSVRLVKIFFSEANLLDLATLRQAGDSHDTREKFRVTDLKRPGGMIKT